MTKFLQLSILLFSLSSIAQTLDPTFGTGGIVINNTSSDLSTASVKQPDDKIIICGKTTNALTTSLFIARFNPDGTLDTTFTNNGYKTIAPLSSDGIEQVLLQPDGKIILCSQYSLLRLNSDGTTDTTFGTNGSTTEALCLNNSIFNKSMTLQSDGKIVTVGCIYSTANINYVAVRYNADGSLDTSFGTGGIAEFDLGSNYDYAFDVAVQSNNKIIVTGQIYNASSKDMATIRINTNGTLDTSFGTDGKIIYSTALNDYGRSIAIQTDDRIVLLGIRSSTPVYFRYNADGTVDTTFNTTGFRVDTSISVSTASAIDSSLFSKPKILYTSSGELFVSGTGYNDFLVKKLNSDGSNATFGSKGNGALTYSINTTNYSNFMSIANDGTISTSGYTTDDTTGLNKVVLLRFSEMGIFQSSKLFTLNTGTASNHKTIEQADGKIVVLSQKQSGTSSSNFVLQRFNTDGTIDTSFGNNSTLDNSFSSYLSDCLINLHNGKIAFSSFGDTKIYRFSPEGIFDNSFGINGVVDLGITTNGTIDFIDEINQGPDGKIYVGYDYILNKQINARCYGVVRLLDNGTVDTSFGTNGVFYQKFNYYSNLISPNYGEFPNEIAFQSDGKIIIGGYLFNNTGNSASHNSIGVLRINADGTLDTSFGTNGTIVIDNFNQNYLDNILILNDDKFILNANFTDTSSSTNFTKTIQYNNDGTIDTTFGTNGYVTDLNYNNDMVLQPDGKILKGGSQNGQFSITRYNVDGSLDTTFGTGGYLNTPIKDSSNIYSLLLLQNGSLLAGGVSLSNNISAATLARYTDLNLGTLSFANQNNNFLVYPNPIQNETTFDYTLTNEESITINLYDIQGKLVKEISKNELQIAGNHKISIDLSGYTSGNYILKFIAPSGNQSLQLLKK